MAKSPPHISFDPGEQVDTELILTALIPSDEMRLTLKTCTDLTLSIIPMDATNQWHSTLKKDDNAANNLEETTAKNFLSSAESLLTLWAEFDSDGLKASIGDFTMDVESIACSDWLKSNS